MVSSAKASGLWFLSAFIMAGGFFALTCPFGKTKRSIPVMSQISVASVPDQVAITNSIDTTKKEEGPPVSRGFVRGEVFFLPIIKRASLRYNIDPALVQAIIKAESEYNPEAISSKGAKGLMQLMPVTARYLGVNDVFNPEQNINGGVRHFKFLLQQFDGDIRLALAAYNAGSSIVKRYKDIPPYKETRRYLKKVFKYYEMYKEKGKRIAHRAKRVAKHKSQKAEARR